MSELSRHPVERLLNRLERSGLITCLELSDEDIADTIWLALQMGVEEDTIKKEKPSGKPPKNQIIVKEGETTEAEFTPQEDSIISIYSKNSITQEKTENQTSNKGLPFQTPAADALQNKLLINRALRPLMRKVPSETRILLDAEATVNRIVEQDIWFPVIKPQPERWLNLELVVEESRSSFIWQETIDELQKLLQNHGAFRTVRTWSLSSSDNRSLQLTRRRKGNQKSHCQHSYRELIHSNGRGLILLVSDCVSGIWQQQEIYQWLEKWSNKVPTAIIQLFPERLWQSSQLGLGYKMQLSAFKPGVPNYDLVLPSLWEELKGEKILKLPVVTLEAFSLREWAKVIVGRGNTSTPGFVLDLNFLTAQIQKEQAKSAATETTSEISAEDLVDRFLATASPTAQKLAGLMAAAPVSLPVVNLIQRTFLPNESTPVNVAEVFLSGIIQKVDILDNNQNSQYDFIPGVRKLLNQATRLGETENVLDVLSSYITENLGLSIKSFTALLLRLQEFSQEQREQILPFAEVTIEVLKNLGSEYVEFAQEVEGSIAASPWENSIDESEEGEFPEPKTCNFKVAAIEILETRTFEFYVATLKQKSSFVGFGNRWVINRLKKQAMGIVEVIKPGIELELMEIPGGSFLMGAREDEQGSSSWERPQHEVTVPSFFMGKYQVTQAEWKVVANLPQIERGLKPEPSRFIGDNRPVERVSWYDAVEFCARLSSSTRRQYRLPSEAEWEYACRAGTKTPFHFGETITTDLANYNGSVYGRGSSGKRRGKATPVGSFDVANAFGLYDMHGNVREWCLDDWHPDYEGATTDGSAWFDNENNNLFQKTSRAVLRGGSWNNNPEGCRSACRGYNSWAERDHFYYSFGFRVVCVVGKTSQ